MMTQQRQSNSSGFRASLDGTSLFDFIQFECNRQAAEGVLVRSNGRVGRLFFADGQIVHAERGNVRGEPALFEILSWEGGEVLPLQVHTPALRTIDRSWQDLLMEAACAEDEANRRSATSEGAEILALHPERNTGVGLRAPRTSDVPASIDAPLAVTLSQPPNGAPVHPSVLDFALSGHDGVLLNQVGNGAWMQQTGSYVDRLANLIGDALALEAFEGLDSAIGAHRLVVRLSATGIATVRGDVSHDQEVLLEGVF